MRRLNIPGPSNSAIPVFREFLFCSMLVFLYCFDCSAEEDSLLSSVSTVMSSLKLFLAAEAVSVAPRSLIFSSCN